MSSSCWACGKGGGAAGAPCRRVDIKEVDVARWKGLPMIAPLANMSTCVVMLIVAPKTGPTSGNVGNLARKPNGNPVIGEPTTAGSKKPLGPYIFSWEV